MEAVHGNTEAGATTGASPAAEPATRGQRIPVPMTPGARTEAEPAAEAAEATSDAGSASERALGAATHDPDARTSL